MVGPGQTLGRYRIESALGAGGMGEVFRAWDTTLRRWVALKVVARDATGRADRLLAEARAVATLKHPNVVSVFDVGETEGVAFVSMDLIVGKTLREYIGDASVTAETKQAWLLQIAGALGAAHRAGLVHRDVKPENVMVGDDMQAHVLDFGIAKAFGIDVVGPTQHSGDEVVAPTAHLTGEGRIIGTPAYMAPEQLAGAPPAPAWDQYAFGVLAYELLTGKHPRISGLIEASGRVKPADQIANDVPPALAEVASHAMAPTPDARFASMDDIVLALGGTVSGVASRVQSLAPPSMPRSAGSTNTPLAKNVAVHDTLPTAMHPGMKTQSTFPAWGRTALVVAAMLVLLGGGIAVGSSLSGRTDPPAPSSNTTASAPQTTTSSWVAPPVASSVASATPSVAPSASVAPSTSVVTTATPPIRTATPPKPALVVQQRATPSMQYDQKMIDRMIVGLTPLVRACIVDHPPRTVPATMGVTLELWSIGNEEGKVRDIAAHEPTPLVECLRGVYEPISFGPPIRKDMPPGAVFITIDVRAP